MPNYVSIKQGHSFIYCYYLAHDQEIVKNIVPCFGVMSSLAIVINIQCSEPEHKMHSQNCNNVFSTQKMTPNIYITVKILKIGTPEIIAIIVLQLEQLDFTVQYCVQKMQTE